LRHIVFDKNLPSSDIYHFCTLRCTDSDMDYYTEIKKFTTFLHFKEKVVILRIKE